MLLKAVRSDLFAHVSHSCVARTLFAVSLYCYDSDRVAATETVFVA